MKFNNLYLLREYNDFSQKQIAEYLKIKHNTYSEYEKGISTIPLKHLNALCIFYDVSMDYILGLEKKSKNSYMQQKLNAKQVGKNIIQFRLENNLKQKDLALILNTTPSTISAYENGKTLILTSFLYQICKKYKLSADKICNRN